MANNLTPVRASGTNTQSPLSSSRSQLSAGLKERLKRCGRYHSTPPSAKRPCVTGHQSANFDMTSPVTTRIHTNSSAHNKVPQTEFASDSFDCSPEPRGDNLGTPLKSNSCSSSRVTFQSRITKLDNLGTPLTLQARSYARISHKKKNEEDLNQISVEDSRGDNLNTFDERKPASESCQSRLNFSDVKKSQICDGGSDEVGTADMSSEHLIKALRNQKKGLQMRLAEKEERLRKLRMVKMYRSKNDLQKLQSLIGKWRSTSQEALTDLYRMLPEPRPTMRQFVHHLQIDAELMQLELSDDDEEEEEGRD